MIVLHSDQLYDAVLYVHAVFDGQWALGAVCSVDSLCRWCLPGSCAPEHGMTECAVCPPGTYSAVHGASSCSPCVHGSYSQLPGTRACRLCPFGYSTTSDGASVCDQVLEQTVAIGKQYALAVSLAVRLSGADLKDVAMRTGVLGPSEDILRFLVSLDSADAFGVSSRDVEVRTLYPRLLAVSAVLGASLYAAR